MAGRRASSGDDKLPSTRQSGDTPGRVRVLLPLPLKGAYDYRAPPGMTLGPGDWVVVPLGAQQRLGVVWPAGNRGGAEEVADDRVKDVLERLGAPPMSAPQQRFIDWVAAYTLSSPGAVLRMAMSVPEALLPLKPITAYRLAAPAGASAEPADGLRLTGARKKVLAAASDGAPRSAAVLARIAGVGAGVVRSLASAGALDVVEMVPEPAPDAPDPDRPGPVLSPDQQAAARTLREQASTGGAGVTLLEGVTGAGKTEVYFEAIAAALKTGRQVLVLLPEIALSAQWLERFTARFGAAPALWHSDLTRGQRRQTWRAVARGAAPVVVGARSALFLPFPELGLVVVDEEHDGSYKQEDGVIYQARDMAVVRGHLTGIPVVLASATPSLETLTNVADGRYTRLHLPERHGPAELPDIALVDLRADPPAGQRWLSPVLEAALSETLAAGEQAMLYLNRRGYAPLTLCRACGYRFVCPDCTAWLVEHRLAGRLQCHHCGFTTPLPETCPDCGAQDSLVPCGPGVERLAEEAAALFPEARILIMASDTVRGPHAAAQLLRQVHDRAVDLVVGTQIMAKGHHFPFLTLVGVVDADLGLSGGDLRAAERTYQLLSQVAGRAGRAERPGRAILQTYMPEHPVMEALASGDRDRFLAEESAARRAQHLPPFGRLAALVVSGRDQRQVIDTARALARAAPNSDGVEVLGPAPAPLAILRGLHRHRLLLKARRGVNVQGTLRRWLGSVRWPGTVKVKADVDPYSFL